MMCSDAIEHAASPAADVRTPTTVDELAQIVREAAPGGQSMRVIGGGTRQAFGNVGAPVEAMISTSRLNRVIEYSPVDLTMAVEPGCTIAQINAVLAENGQVLPLDVAHPEEATVGGSFATGLSGPSRLKHGSLKDRVIGLEVINAAGVETKSGGMVVKNVSGYELGRLHYGALGAFGLVTRINLKVAPRPEVTRGLRASFSTLTAALDAGRKFGVSRLEPVAVFVFGSGDPWTLHVWFAGARWLVDAQIERAMAEVVGGGGSISVDTSASETGRLEAFEPFVDLRSGMAIVRVSASPTRQQQTVEALVDAGSREVCADTGSGLVYALAYPAREWRDAVGRLIERPVFLALPDDLKRDIDVFGGMDAAPATIIRRLKREYDPGNMFNPGRFALGL